MKITPLVSSAVLAFALTEAHALDMTGQGYAQQLSQGDPAAIRQAAQQMTRARYADLETLDVAAEVLLQSYQNNLSKPHADALAWVCKALASSGNGRYKATLSQVVDNTRNRKLKGHCKKAHNSLKSSGAPYTPGSINLNAYRTGQSGVAYAAPAAQPLQSGYAAAPAQYQDARNDPQQPAGKGFANIRQGMTMEEVIAQIGAPASTFSHQTGKGWIPFNFQGKDVMRIIALYPGQGRITYNQVSVYSRVWRVLEVNANPLENGRP